jgi:hypothetical protein
VCGKLVCWSSVVLVLALLGAGEVFGVTFTAGPDPDLVGWWMFDEGQGTTAEDSSGNDNDGTLQGNPAWVAGRLNGALQFNGTDAYVNCGNGPTLQIQNQITLACWLRTPGFTRNWAAIITKGDGSWRLSRSGETGNSIHMGLNGTVVTSANPWFDASKAVTDNQWHHIAGTYDGSYGRIYIDGVQVASLAATGQLNASSNNVLIAENEGGTGRYLSGTLDDVRIYRRGLTVAEVQIIMKGYAGPVADAPNPEDQATDVARDVVLSWLPGAGAATHDVYFGTVLADVNTASRTNPKGVLVSQGQDANTYDPAGLLAFGQTYYWRVDEIAAAPEATTSRGPVWTFTVETYGYAVTPVQATASSAQTSMGPEKTIDGSGLNAQDQHATTSSAMWLAKSTPLPAWIKYEFDRSYKLYELWVWNSNQSMEAFMGYGAKDVLIEASQDDVTWTAVGAVRRFAQATGKAGYAHNTTVDLGGTVARYVRLTIQKTWSGGAQAGLSEVRFFCTPLAAYGPQPADGTTDVALNATLTWRPGREAVRHNVYFSTEADAVLNGAASAGTVTTHAFDLSSLGVECGRTYYWKVDEVNDAASPAVWPGDLWSFTTIGYVGVDDFESYDDECNRIFFSWVDGYGFSDTPSCDMKGSAGNGTNSTIGNMQAPFAEQTIVRSGRQAMPMGFDNTMNPFYSEATRQWSTPQSWTSGGVDTLTLYVRGVPTAFTSTGTNSFVMNGMGANISGIADEFRFAYKSLAGNGSIIARVDGIGATNIAAKVAVMIRENLSANSAFAMVTVTPGAGVLFERRSASATAVDTTTQAGITAPCWVKLTRVGDTFTAQRSADGVTWTSITTDAAASTAAVPMTASTVYVGLAVCSREAAIPCGAKLSNVATTGGVSGAWQVAEIGRTQAAGNTPETFYVAVEDNSGRMKRVSHPDPMVIATGLWEEWHIPLSEFTAAGIKLGGIKKMTIGVGNPTSPARGGAGSLYLDDIRLTRQAP